MMHTTMCAVCVRTDHRSGRHGGADEFFGSSRGGGAGETAVWSPGESMEVEVEVEWRGADGDSIGWIGWEGRSFSTQCCG